MKKQLKIRGINLVYEDLGQGLPLVFIHGHPLNRSVWQYQAGALAAGYRLILPDLRGYGETGIPGKTTLLDELALDIIHLCAALQVTKAVFVGLAMGGQIVFELYRLVPQLFAGMVLADTSAAAESEETYKRSLQLAAYIQQQGMKVFAKERLHRFLSKHTLANNAPLVAKVKNMMETTSATGSAMVQEGRAERTSYIPLLPGICCPVLLIAGAEDEFMPVEASRQIQAGIPHATLVVINDAAHIPNMEQPDEFNQHLRSFLQLIEPASG